MGSSHSKKTLETFSKQKEGGKIRRQQKQEVRRAEFENRRATIRRQVLEMTPIQWVMAFLVGMVGFTIGALMMFYRIIG